MRARPAYPVWMTLLASAVLVTGATAAKDIDPAVTARIDATLLAELEGLADGAMTPIIVVLADQVDLERLDAEVYSRGLDRSERFELVRSSLKSVATSSQVALRGALAAREARGEVDRVRSFWLINAFALDATRSAILDIAARQDVERVSLDGILELDQPEEEHAAASAPGQAEVGLRVVNAPALWERGYTGAGTIVMNIDTGVAESHPALTGQWLGNQGYPAEQCWFDPVQQSCTTPCDYGSSDHGSHTMGIMVGLDPATADTTGVAFGASWIAAATIVGAPSHTSYSIAAFEWAADPGGGGGQRGPADVISCSWWDPSVTFQGDCGPNGTYWEVVDNFEALGGAVTFSAGNGGPGAQTITRPKNRISSPVNMWATGNIQGHIAGFPIRASSSRGPSECDNLTPKPEAVAPGTSVRAPLSSGYGTKTGTSMASPHVAGVIALLMEAFPWATGTEIKLALIATAVDLGDPGEDNTYGNGLIDAGAAYEFLSETAALREQPTAPRETAVHLDQNVPNPFNPSTTIAYELPSSATVSLRVYDHHGRLVATLVDQVSTDAGSYSDTWDGTTTSGGAAASGMYFFRLEARGDDPHAAPIVRSRKAILLK